MAKKLVWKTRKWDWNPTTTQLQTAGPTEYPVGSGFMDVHRGTLIGSVAVRINTAFTAGAPTVTVGTHGGDLDGLVVAADVTIGTKGLYNGTGQELCTKHTTGPNANGKLYTADGYLVINYTGAGATTKGALSVIVTYCEIE